MAGRSSVKDFEAAKRLWHGGVPMAIRRLSRINENHRKKANVGLKHVKIAIEKFLTTLGSPDHEP